MAAAATQPAHASTEGLALNGTYLATSNGDWAKTNEAYHDEVSVRSVWTINSTCSNAFECAGTVTSDQGWTAPIFKTSTSWTVDRELPTWQPCPDGTSFPGTQKFRFYRVDAYGQYDLNNESSVFAGEDKTTGQSGACGVSKTLLIRMPFRLEKLT
jgi:hypothetical protein